MRRVGILGGTFNPIHSSHLLLAEYAYRQLHLDSVIFMPSNNPPHKNNREIAPDEDRAAMIKLAIEDTPYFEFSDLELKREGTTYTSDTLRILNETCPDTRFYFIIGGDSLINFNTWHEPESILHRCALVCSGRADYDKAAVFDNIRKLREQYGSDGFIPEIHYLNAPSMDLSSTTIRLFSSFDMPVHGMVSDKVEQYILSKSLYRNTFFEDVKKSLSVKLKPSRYEHDISVARTAVWMALSNGCDIVKAYTAGLLHDCGKYADENEMLDAVRRRGIVLDETEERTVQLVHARLGAVLASDIYGIDDEDIINAVRYHTTGRPDMSLLEKIIYLADALEPLRSWDEGLLDTLRPIAHTDIDLAMYMMLGTTLSHLEGSSCTDNICNTTLDAYNYYKGLIEAR